MRVLGVKHHLKLVYFHNQKRPKSEYCQNMMQGGGVALHKPQAIPYRMDLHTPNVIHIIRTFLKSQKYTSMSTINVQYVYLYPLLWLFYYADEKDLLDYVRQYLLEIKREETQSPHAVIKYFICPACFGKEPSRN